MIQGDSTQNPQITGWPKIKKVNCFKITSDKFMFYIVKIGGENYNKMHFGHQKSFFFLQNCRWQVNATTVLRPYVYDSSSPPSLNSWVSQIGQANRWGSYLSVLIVRAGRKVLMEVDFNFTECRRFRRDFRTAAQASPDPLIKYYCFIN